MRKRQIHDFPSVSQLKAELERETRRVKHRRVAVNSIVLSVFALVLCVLLIMVITPILEIYGTAMVPTLREGDVVLTVRDKTIERGDIVAFHFGSKLLVKRCIALPGDVINISADGDITVNNILLEEPYIAEKALGDCDFTFPYTVPENRYFLIGDNRVTSIDSRSSTVGCILKEQIIGRVAYRLLPYRDSGKIGSST